MMRITFILPVVPRVPSGGARVVYEYANRLVARGCQVTVVHEQWREGWGRPIRHAYEIARDRWHYRKPAGLIEWLRWMPIDPRVRMRLVRKLEPTLLPDADVVVATYWTTALLLPRLAAQHGAPVHLVQNYENLGVPNPADVDRALLLEVPKIAVSRYLAELMSRLGVPSSQIAIVQNGLDHSVYRPPAAARARGRGVGTLLSPSPTKGSADTIAALEHVRREVPGLVVNAFGVERRPAQLPKWARYWRGVSGDALARRVYQASSVYLCGSVREGWGFPAAEAMACGAAVVSTRNGGVEDFCFHERNSLLVAVGDVPAMASAVTRLLHDDELRRRIADAGLHTASTMDWRASADAFTAALHSAMGG